MVEDRRRDAPRTGHRTQPATMDRTELNRLVELELDRWTEHQRELQRRRRRRAAWRDTEGVEAASS